MSTINLPIIGPSLPVGYCWPTPQQYANDIFAGAIVQFDITGYKGILVQSTTPTAAQRTGYAWYNTTTGRLLWYDPGQAAWVFRHPEAPGGSVRRIFVGALADIDTYDGGAAGVPAAVAGGPMWERDTTFNDRAPFGVGTDVATVLSTGGVSSVSIAKANLPTDQLYVKTAIVGQASVGTDVPVVNNTYGSDAVSGTGRAVDSTSSDFSGRYYTRGQSEPLGSGTALSVQNKYVGCFFIKRTIREYYTS